MRTRVVSFAVLALFAAIFLTSSTPSLAQSVSVTAANPNTAPPNSVALKISISGNGFKKGAKASFLLSGTTNPGDIAVVSTTFVSSNQVDATINVASTAVDASYDIAVANTNGSSGKGTELFAVKNQSAPGQCTDVSLQAIYAPGTPNGGSSAIFGDGKVLYNNPNDASDPFNGGTVFTDGEGGIYAKFQVCNLTNDFILNLNQTKRFLQFDFTKQIPGAPADPQAAYKGGTVYNSTGSYNGFMNSNQVGNDALYDSTSGTPTLITCLGTTIVFTGKDTSHAAFHSVASTNTPGCEGQGPGVQSYALFNTPYQNSSIQVTKPNACTYIIRTMPSVDSRLAGQHVSGLNEQMNKVIVTGGQYQLPVLIKLIKAGCTP